MKKGQQQKTLSFVAALQSEEVNSIVMMAQFISAPLFLNLSSINKVRSAFPVGATAFAFRIVKLPYGEFI